MKISKLLKDRIPAKLWYKLFYKEELEKSKTFFDEVMDTRIQINKILKNSKELDEVDNLLFKLNVSISSKAIDTIKK